MSPAEAAAFLRRYNEWRRTDDRYGIPYPDPREIGEAIDAAVEMIDRLEAAEKSDAESIAMYRKARDERDALRAKIEQMERQEPVAWGVFHFGGKRNGKLYSHCESEKQARMYILDRHQSDDSNTFREAPLYALPSAQPAPSVPNLDMDALERQNDDLKAEVGRLRDALALIADQYEPKCSLLIPSIARTALNATGAYGQKESPESWPTEAMVTAFAELFNVRDQKNTFGPAFRAALTAAAPEAKP